MAIQTINLGNYANDGTGDDLRVAFTKVNANFAALDSAAAISNGVNVGSGVGVFFAKDSTNLQFKSLTSTGNSVTISSTGNTVNLESITRLQSDPNPVLSGNLNLNNHYVYGGDIQSTVYGYSVPASAMLHSLLVESNNLNVDMGSFLTPTGYETDGLAGRKGYLLDYGLFSDNQTNDELNFGTFSDHTTGGIGQITLAGNLTTIGANNLTLTTTANTSLTLPTSGTLTTTANNLSAFAATTSAQLAGVISDETGTGKLVFATSPTLVSPTIGAAVATSLTFPDTTVQSVAFVDDPAHIFYVHPNTGRTYTATGTYNSPFATITAAINAAVAEGHSDSDPATIILMAGITENVTLQPGIYLTSLGTGTHGSPNITGTVTVTSSTGTVSSNHYSISNLRIIAPTNGRCIYFTGTAPQKLFVRDMWLDTNGTGSCIYTDNTGSGSTLQLDIAHMTHSGSGDVYCINVTKGSCYVTDIETSGAVQVAAVQTGAVLTIDGSELDANGDVVVESYGTGSLTITNSIINNTAANSNGIKVNGLNATTVIGNCVFTIPTGTGKVINNVQSSATNVLAYAGIVMSTGYNATVDLTFTLAPLNNAAGNLVATSLTSPTLVTSLLAGSSTIALLNTTATTINAFGAATTIGIGNASGTTTIAGRTSTTNLSRSGLEIAVPNYITVSSTATYVLSTTVTENILLVTAGALTATLTFPNTGLIDGQRLKFTVTTNTVTLALTAGPTLVGTFAGSVTAPTTFTYVYRTSNTTWYRI